MRSVCCGRWLSNDKTLWKAANHNLASQMVAEAIQGAIPRRHGTEVLRP